MRYGAACLDGMKTTGTALLELEDGKVLFQNTAFTQLVDKAKEEIKNRTQNKFNFAYDDVGIMSLLLAGDRKKIREYSRAMDKREIYKIRVMIVPPYKAREEEDGDEMEDSADENYPGLWYNVVCSAMPSGERKRSSEGEMIKDTWRVVCNIRDVTAQRMLEVETREKTDMLFANVSHELRTPLNGIIAMADVLSSSLKGRIDDADEESLQVILSSGQRLSNLVTNLLDQSLLNKKKLEVHHDKDVDLFKIVS